MAKWLMDKNQQPSVKQELGRLFPSIRGRGRRVESSELHGAGAGESSASATDTNKTSLISSLIFQDRSLKFSKQKLSYFEPFQFRPK